MSEPVRKTCAATTGELSVGDIYYLLFRYKWTLLMCSLLGVLAAIALYLVTPAVYQSEAALIVRYVNDTGILQELSTGERITVPGRGGENVINSEIAILTSRDLMEKVADEMGPGLLSTAPSNEVVRGKIAENMMKALDVEAPKNSNIIRLAFRSRTPEIAQGALDRLTRLYLQRHNEIHREGGAYEFLSRQTDELNTRLQATERELGMLKQKEGIVSIEEAKKGAAQRIADLGRGVDELEINLAAARARRETLRAVLPEFAAPRTAPVEATTTVATTGEAAVKESDRITSLRYRLSTLQRREADLLAAYTTDSIPVRSVQEQIAALAGLLAAEGVSPAGKPVAGGATVAPPVSAPAAGRPHSNLLDPLLEEEATVAALQARMGVQKVMLERAKEEARKLDAVESSIVQLQRSKELHEANYRYFCQSLEHARVDDALNSGRITNINVVQTATRPTQRTLGKLGKKIGLVFLAGIGLGIGLVVLREYFLDTTIRRVGELVALFGTSRVMTFPLLERGALVSRRAAGGAVTEHPAMMEFCDAFWVQLLPELSRTMSTPPYVLGVTGCTPGSGVSAFADGLALALAREIGGKIMLLDASDGVTPVCYEVGLDGQFVSSHPRQEETAAEGGQASGAGGLAGARLQEVGSTRSQAFLSVLDTNRDRGVRFVIVDLPPVTETGLTLRVACLLNGVVMVLPAGRIARGVAGHICRWLTLSNARVIGCVLNMRRKYVPAWLCQNL